MADYAVNVCYIYVFLRTGNIDEHHSIALIIYSIMPHFTILPSLTFS